MYRLHDPFFLPPGKYCKCLFAALFYRCVLCEFAQRFHRSSRSSCVVSRLVRFSKKARQYGLPCWCNISDYHPYYHFMQPIHLSHCQFFKTAVSVPSTVMIQTLLLGLASQLLFHLAIVCLKNTLLLEYALPIQLLI